MPIKKAEKEIGSSPINPPTDAELGIGDDWIDQYDYESFAHLQAVDHVVDLDKAKVAMAKLQNLKYNKTDGQCTADPHSKVGKKLYKKQPITLMVHDFMTITKPVFMEKPKPGDCVCDDCQHAFIDQIEAYEDYLDDLKHFEEVTAQIKLDALKAEVLDKQQTLAEKKKIAEEYLKQEAAKNATKKPQVHPLLVVKPSEESTFLKKATSVKGSSHDKTGKFGGVSLYNDADVDQARAYMNSVLGIESMSVNGRALEHILAEVYGFAKQDSEMEVRNLKSKMKLQDGLESQITQLKTMLGKVSTKLEAAEVQLDEHAKYVEVAKKIDKEAVVAKTSTGRRIKE